MQLNPYQALVSLLSNILEAYTTAFFILDPKNRQLNLAAAQSLSKFLPDTISLELEQSGILAQAQKVGQTIHLDKLQDLSPSLSQTVPFYRDGESHIKGLYVVPVGDGAGVLYVDTKYAWGFNDKQQKHIREVAGVLNHLLQRQGCVRQQQNYARMFELWNRLNEAAVKDDHITEYCHLAVSECTRFLGAEYGFLALRESGKAHYHVIAATPNVPRSITDQRILASQGLVGWIFENQKQLFVPRLNPQTADHFLFTPSEGLPHHGTFWGIPGQMALGQTVILAFLSRQAMDWSSEAQAGIAHALDFSRLLLDQCCMKEECHQLQAYDLCTGLYNALAFEARLETMLAASMQGSSPLTLSLIQFEPWQVLFTKASPKQVRQWQADLASALCEALPANVLVGQIAENRFGLLFPGTTPHEAKSYMNRSSDAARQVFAGKLKGIKLKPFQSTAGFPQDGARSEELWPLVYSRLFEAFRS